MPTILAIQNSSNKGKSATVREFANLLLTSCPSIVGIKPSVVLTQLTQGEVSWVVNINGRIIGIESQGDPNTDLYLRLDELVVKYNCELIICTTRTKGETVGAVNIIKTKYGFDTIWTSSYDIENSNNHSLVNTLKANHILDLLVQLNLI